MKNTSITLVFIAFCAFMLGCDKCKDNCGREVSISAILPNNNPVGYEVLLKTDGFSNAAQVVFGTEKANSRPGGSAGEIIAKVPAGLSGNVEISVEEGDCIGRLGGFVVTGALPSDFQPSLQNIIVPVPTTFPQDGFSNNWVNAADSTGFSFGIHLNGLFVNGISSLEGSYEFNYIDPKYDNSTVTGTANNNTNVIYLEVDHSTKGGIVEHFDGIFIKTPSILIGKADPNLTAILLTSRDTGRQLLLYIPV